jgi:ankyrin repeat protein
MNSPAESLKSPLKRTLVCWLQSASADFGRLSRRIHSPVAALVFALSFAACGGTLHQAIEKDEVNKARELIDDGADVNAPDEEGESPLHIAATLDTDEAAMFLLAHGAAVNAQDHHGDTPLHIAARHGNDALVVGLLRHGAAVNATNALGETPLHVALLELYEEADGAVPRKVDDEKADSAALLVVARTLVSAGADLNATDLEGRTALLIVAATGDESSAELVALLVAKTGDPNRPDATGNTPLHYAVHNNRKAIVSVLLRSGARVNVTNDRGQRPLHLAKGEGVAKLLVAKGADLEARDRKGETPLATVAGEGGFEVVEQMILLGAGVNAKDSLGRTPLHHAILECQRGAAAALLAHGADVNVRDHDGQTPLTEALYQENERKRPDCHYIIGALRERDAVE